MQAADSLEEVSELVSNLHCSKQTLTIREMILKRDAGLGRVSYLHFGLRCIC